MLSAGLGGMGGAQPLAVTMNGGVGLFVEVDRERIERRLAPALRRSHDGLAGRGARLGGGGARSPRAAVDRAARQRRRDPSGARAARRALRRRDRSDLRPRHDQRLRPGRAVGGRGGGAARARRQGVSAARATSRSPRRCARCSSSSAAAPSSSTTATTSAARRRTPGVARLRYPGFVPAFIRPLFCEGQGPFRWVALSGDPEDIYAHRPRAAGARSPDNEHARALAAAWPASACSFQGLPARICWLGYGERAQAGRIFNELVAAGRREGARSSSAATTSTRARSPRPTARPSRCATAPTPSPTGRS